MWVSSLATPPSGRPLNLQTMCMIMARALAVSSGFLAMNERSREMVVLVDGLLGWQVITSWATTTQPEAVKRR